MPRFTQLDRRKHLIIVLIALVIALAILFIQTETASASTKTAAEPAPAGIDAPQVSADDYQNAVTTERLLILGMLGLVVLTWFYLRWRPPPGYEQDPDREQPPDGR